MMAVASRISEPKWVSIVKDPAAALWLIRCTKPCQPAGHCMHGPEGRHAPHCWLGSATTQAGAEAMAHRHGYGVTQ